jgi:hypothetical protein
VKLTTHLPLFPKLKISGSIPPLHHKSSGIALPVKTIQYVRVDRKILLKWKTSDVKTQSAFFWLRINDSSWFLWTSQSKFCILWREGGNFLYRWLTISFWGRILVYGVNEYIIRVLWRLLLQDIWRRDQDGICWKPALTDLSNWQAELVNSDSLFEFPIDYLEAGVFSIVTVLRNIRGRTLGLIPDREKKIFLFFQTSRTAPEFIHSLTQCTLQVLGLEIELLRGETDHSSPSIAELKNMWNCTSNPPIWRLYFFFLFA